LVSEPASIQSQHRTARGNPFHSQSLYIQTGRKARAAQPHTIRGFISTISKKMKLAIESVRNEQGQRVYRVK
jgi:hypothetical protein